MSTNITKEIEDMKVALAALEAKAAKPELKLTKISFKSQAELALALINGRSFKTRLGSVLTYEVTRNQSPFRITAPSLHHTSMEMVWMKFDNLLEINAAAPWYEDIPMLGIQCYMSDCSEIPTSDSYGYTIIAYKPTKQFPFIDKDGMSWKYAIPVNPK